MNAQGLWKGEKTARRLNDCEAVFEKLELKVGPVCVVPGDMDTSERRSHKRKDRTGNGGKQSWVLSETKL